MIFNEELIKLRSAYFLDEWISFNEKTWGVRAEKVCYGENGKDLPRLEGILYLNKKGKVVLPPTNAYLPFQFLSTNTIKNCQTYSQWMQVSELLAEDIKKRGYSGTIAFPPGFIDGRAFQWLGINISTGYTFVGELPVDENSVDTSVRKNIRKAEKAGYTVQRSHNWEDILFCINKTESVKGFDLALKVQDLEESYRLLGDKYLFAHVVYSADGNPVSGQVKIAMPDGICIDWLAGTDRNHINNGVNQLAYMKAITDIAETGTPYFDYCGANIKSVAKAKSMWSFQLTPYIILTEDPFKMKLKFLAKKSAFIRNLYSKYHHIKNTNRE